MRREQRNYGRWESHSVLGQHFADDGNLVFIIWVKPVQNRHLKPLFEPHL